MNGQWSSINCSSAGGGFGMIRKASHAFSEIGWLASAYCIIGEIALNPIATATRVIAVIASVLFIEEGYVNKIIKHILEIWKWYRLENKRLWSK